MKNCSLKLMCAVPLILMVLNNFSQAQSMKKDPKIGNWTMFFGQAKLNQQFGLHLEGQFRDYNIVEQPQQILLRTGLIYYLNSSCNFTVGYAHVSNYIDDNKAFENPVLIENRIWQQFLMRNTIGRFYFEHRYRLEQRWLNYKSSDDTYRNRIRYMLRINIPLNKKLIEGKTFFLSLYDECFLHLEPNPFDRNRLYAGIAYQLNTSLNLQLGYMAQSTNVSTKYHLQLVCNYTINLKKQ